MFLVLFSFALLPIITTISILLIEKKKPNKRLGYWQRQIIIGVVFGVIACLASQFGINSGDANINVRNAAPLVAGLAFGGPAGIIASVMGAVYRYVGVIWGLAEYTRLACSVSTLLTGVIGAFGHRIFMTKIKNLSWVYGSVLTVISEVLHMLLIFFTNSSDPVRAFLVIEQCAIPMITANTVSVALSLIVITVINREKKRSADKKNSVSDVFQIGLIVCILVGVIISGVATYTVYTTVETEWVYGYVDLAVDKLHKSIKNSTDTTITLYVDSCASLYPRLPIEQCVAYMSDGSYINPEEEPDVPPRMFITDPNGKCIDTSDDSIANVGETVDERFFDILSIPYADTFDEENKIHVSNFHEETASRYCAKILDDGNILFAVFGKGSTRQVDSLGISGFAKTQSIGETGYLLVISGDLIISDGRNTEIENFSETFPTLDEVGLTDSFEDLPIGEYVVRDILGEESFCLRIKYIGTFGEFDGLFVHPVAEMEHARNAAVYANVLLQILIFTVILVITYLISNRVVINKIDRVNSSLTKIAAGDLGEAVNVREYEEFNSLSNDINATVDTLKRYIDEANTRIDKDLAFAKEIQDAALPAVFPPYPNRKDFDIFATMDAAKTIGGDFYDLYLADKDHLVFLVADVSGKSIPGAMFMMRSKTIIKSMVDKGMSVEEVFCAANNYLVEGNRAKMFVTCWMGVADLRTGMLSFANAGHNPPLVRHKNGQFEYIRTTPNFVLAGKKNIKYNMHQMQLLPGDSLFLYTDGVTEALNGDEVMFGEARLLDALNESPNEQVDQRCRRIKQKLDDFVGEVEQFDDITMLSVNFNSFADDDRIITGSEPESAEIVWKFICDKIKRDDIKQIYAEKIHIIVDEIQSNTIRYSGAQMSEISVSISDGELKLVFKDNGKQYDPLAGPDPNVKLTSRERKIGGLGIFMVKKLSNSISYSYKDGYNVLSVSLSIDPADDCEKT